MGLRDTIRMNKLIFNRIEEGLLINHRALSFLWRLISYMFALSNIFSYFQHIYLQTIYLCTKMNIGSFYRHLIEYKSLWVRNTIVRIKQKLNYQHKLLETVNKMCVSISEKQYQSIQEAVRCTFWVYTQPKFCALSNICVCHLFPINLMHNYIENGVHKLCK